MKEVPRLDARLGTPLGKGSPRPFLTLPTAGAARRVAYVRHAGAFGHMDLRQRVRVRLAAAIRPIGEGRLR